MFEVHYFVTLCHAGEILVLVYLFSSLYAKKGDTGKTFKLVTVGVRLGKLRYRRGKRQHKMTTSGQKFVANLIKIIVIQFCLVYILNVVLIISQLSPFTTLLAFISVDELGQ